MKRSKNDHMKFNIRDKRKALSYFTHLILSKTNQTFEYENLPETVPKDILERFLQTNGDVIWYKHNNELYVFTGGKGGEPDVYYRPTLYLISNPALNLSKNIKIDEDGVLMKNDTYNRGLLPLIYKYGTLLIESDISFYNAIVNTRDYNTYSAPDDKTRASAEEYQRQIEAGYTSVIAENQLLEGLKKLPSTQSQTLNDLRETYQYVKSLLYSELGIKTSHNMKRQYVSEEENIINDDSLVPFVENMLYEREIAIEKVNEMFDLDIKVKLGSIWEIQEREIEKTLEILEEETVELEEVRKDVEEEIEEEEEQDDELQTED